MWHLHIYTSSSTTTTRASSGDIQQTCFFTNFTHTGTDCSFYLYRFPHISQESNTGYNRRRDLSHTWMMITDFHPKLHILIQTLEISYSFLWLGTSLEISNMEKSQNYSIWNCHLPGSPNSKKHCIEGSLFLCYG